MSVITVFNGLFCQAGPVVKRVLDDTGFTLVSDQELTARASKLSGMSEEKIARAFSAGTSVFNKFSHEKERAVAWLRMAVAETLLERDNLLFSGFASQLPAGNISSILRVCLVAEMSARLAPGRQGGGIRGKARPQDHPQGRRGSRGLGQALERG